MIVPVERAVHQSKVIVAAANVKVDLEFWLFRRGLASQNIMFTR